MKNELKLFEVFLSDDCPYEYRSVGGITFAKFVLVRTGYCSKCDMMVTPSCFGVRTCPTCGAKLEYERDAKSFQVRNRVKLTYAKVAKICLKAKEKFIKKRILDADGELIEIKDVPVIEYINFREIEVDEHGKIVKSNDVNKNKLAEKEAERIKQEQSTIEEQKKLQEMLKAQERDKLAVLEAKIKELEMRSKSDRENELEKQIAELEELLEEKTKSGKGSKK